jgi:uncharacterized damage-inducible protein DinB
MNMYALTTEELLSFCSEEHQRWHRWLQANPNALDLPSHIARTTSVRELVLHIVLVELRYSERLLNKEVTQYEGIPTDNLDQLFGIAKQAEDNFRKFCRTAADSDWNEVLTFPTRSAGTLTASKRKMFVHSLLHGMRHWAQLSTLLRQRGLPQDWPHDFLMSPVME